MGITVAAADTTGFASCKQDRIRGLATARMIELIQAHRTLRDGMRRLVAGIAITGYGTLCGRSGSRQEAYG